VSHAAIKSQKDAPRHQIFDERLKKPPAIDGRAIVASPRKSVQRISHTFCFLFTPNQPAGGITQLFQSRNPLRPTPAFPRSYYKLSLGAVGGNQKVMLLRLVLDTSSFGNGIGGSIESTTDSAANGVRVVDAWRAASNFYMGAELFDNRLHLFRSNSEGGKTHYHAYLIQPVAVSKALGEPLAGAFSPPPPPANGTYSCSMWSGDRNESAELADAGRERVRRGMIRGPRSPSSCGSRPAARPPFQITNPQVADRGDATASQTLRGGLAPSRR